MRDRSWLLSTGSWCCTRVTRSGRSLPASRSFSVSSHTSFVLPDTKTSQPSSTRIRCHPESTHSPAPSARESEAGSPGATAVGTWTRCRLSRFRWRSEKRTGRGSFRKARSQRGDLHTRGFGSPGCAHAVFSGREPSESKQHQSGSHNHRQPRKRGGLQQAHDHKVSRERSRHGTGVGGPGQEIVKQTRLRMECFRRSIQLIVYIANPGSFVGRFCHGH